MSKLVLTAAAFALSLSTSYACDFHSQSVQAERTDPTVVASVEKKVPMSMLAGTADEAKKTDAAATAAPAVSD